ncbi:MAG: sulfotransferase [Planctomycetes bacterium]|nr:sulfotransferase [Planctomycetota bacterium]
MTDAPRQVESDGDRVERLASKPILIVGAPRSGTTWVQRLLLGDPRCCGSQESHFFVTFGRVLGDFDDKAGRARPHGLACYWKRADLVAELRRLWGRSVGTLIERSPAAEILVEKTPDHACWLDVIDEILPSARIVHVVRDSRAVCASLLHASRQPWGGPWAPSTAGAAAAKWREHVEAAERSGARLGSERFMRLHQEDLHEDPPREMGRLWRFAGLEVEPARLSAIADAAAKPGGPAFEMTGELEGAAGPEPDGFARGGAPNRWRRELGPWQRWVIWRETAAAMRRLGYDRSGRARGGVTETTE